MAWTRASSEPAFGSFASTLVSTAAPSSRPITVARTVALRIVMAVPLAGRWRSRTLSRDVHAGALFERTYKLTYAAALVYGGLGLAPQCECGARERQIELLILRKAE